MSMIDAVVGQHRATRVFFDCRNAAPDPADVQRIAQTMARSIALGQAEDDAPVELPLAA